MMSARSQGCEQARAWLSLRVDDELSEVEGALLDAHLAGCAGCSAAAVGVEGLSRLLRTAPLAVPPRRPVAQPSARRHGSLRRFQVAAASAVVVIGGVAAASVFAALQLVDAGQPQKLTRVSAVADGTPDEQLLARVRVLRNERPLPGHLPLT